MGQPQNDDPLLRMFRQQSAPAAVVTPHATRCPPLPNPGLVTTAASPRCRPGRAGNPDPDWYRVTG